MAAVRDLSVTSFTASYELPAYAKAYHELMKVPPVRRGEIREKAGISRGRFAELLNITVATLRKWETSSTPTETEAVRYWQHLNAVMLPEPESLTEEDALKAAEYFQTHFDRDPPTVCDHCGGLHARACPRVKRLVRHSDGTWLEVEYWETWPETNVIFPESLADE